MSKTDPRNWMWTEACAMLDRADRLQRQFFQPDLPSSRAPNWQPPVDIIETDKEVWIIAALPGVEAKDLEVAVDGAAVLIGGVRHRPAIAGGAAIQRLEIPYGRFERRMPLASARMQLGRSELTSGCLILNLKKRP